MVEFNQTTYQFAEGGDDMVCLVIRAIDSISDRVSITVTITLAGDSTILDAGSGGTYYIGRFTCHACTYCKMLCEKKTYNLQSNFCDLERLCCHKSIRNTVFVATPFIIAVVKFDAHKHSCSKALSLCCKQLILLGHAYLYTLVQCIYLYIHAHGYLD